MEITGKKMLGSSMYSPPLEASSSAVEKSGMTFSNGGVNSTSDLEAIDSSGIPSLAPLKMKRKRNLPGTPDPEAEVIAMSPRALMATNRFVCEICQKGFQRDQNLQLHRRGHNLPWKLRQRPPDEDVMQKKVKRVYVCPEPGCVHHHPSRALGDLTGIKKHFSRKHGEKKWNCTKCDKSYAVQADWKAHSKTCGTREYRCPCGTIFSRKDSFVTHRAFCEALAEENARISTHTYTREDPSKITSAIVAAPTKASLPPPPPPPPPPPTNSSFIENPARNSAENSPENSNKNLVENSVEYSVENSVTAPKVGLDECLPTAPPFLSLWLGSGPQSSAVDSSLPFLMGSADRLPLFSQTDRATLMPSSLPFSLTSRGGDGEKDRAIPRLPSFCRGGGAQNACMSATALLQKAEQMGATAKNSPLLRCFGLGSTTSSMQIRPNPTTDNSDMLSSSSPSSIRWPTDTSSENYGLLHLGGGFSHKEKSGHSPLPFLFKTETEKMGMEGSAKDSAKLTLDFLGVGESAQMIGTDTLASPRDISGVASRLDHGSTPSNLRDIWKLDRPFLRDNH